MTENTNTSRPTDTTDSAAAATSLRTSAARDIAVGSPCWVDLGVPDLDAVKDFYTAILGWEFQDMGAEYGHYHMISRAGAAVGGAMSMQQDWPDQGAAWTVYLTTDDIEGALTATAAAGGRVMTPAMPMPGLGSMAIVVAPGGECLGLWQSDGFEGFAREQAPGAPVWFEVMSFDFATAAAYYRSVWGWQPTALGQDGAASDADPDSGEHYVNNHPGEAASAGLCPAPREWFPEGTAPFWRAYFAVEDVDAACALVTELGGTVVTAAEETPFGRLASVTDPAGAAFQLAQTSA